MKYRHGFTLIELLIVIAVIAILATLILGGTGYAKRRAREEVLKKQMQQIALGLEGYSDGNEWKYPHRLTHLFPKYCNDPKAFLDPNDPSEGKEGCKPDIAMNQYTNLDEGPDVDEFYSDTMPCSLLYPFANVPIDPGFLNYLNADSFDQVNTLSEVVPSGGGNTKINVSGDPNGISWKEGKIYQLKYGDGWWKSQMAASGQRGGYPVEWFPVVRSFWHMSDPDDSTEEKVAVVTKTGKFWWSTPKWENDVLNMLNLTPEGN